MFTKPYHTKSVGDLEFQAIGQVVLYNLDGIHLGEYPELTP